MDKKVLSTIFVLLSATAAANAEGKLAPAVYQSPIELSRQIDSEYYTNGMKYVANRDYTQAINEFKKVLRETPNNKKARLQLVSAYALRAENTYADTSDYNKSANDYRCAIFYLKYYNDEPVPAEHAGTLEVLERNLSNILSAIHADQTAKGHYLMGKSLRAQAQFAAAAVEFQNAKNDAEYKKSSLKNLGEIYYMLNLDEQAVKYLTQAIALDSQNSELHLKLAGCYEHLGKLENAAREYNLALNNSKNNAEILDSLENIWRQKVQDCPDDAEAHANLGAIFQRKNDYNAALAQYERAESLNPSNITTRLNIGTLYQAKKEYETAIEAYDTIIAVDANYMPAYLYKAQCYKALGVKNAAIQNYKLALNLDPTNKSIKDELYALYEENMTPEERLNYYYEKITQEPQNAELTYKYAYELHKAGRIAEAISFYEATTKLDSSNEDAYINLVQAFQQQGNFERAREVLNDAKTKFPENQTIKKQLASLDAQAVSMLYSNASELFRQKKFKEAIAMYEKIQPATPEALVGIGASYQSLGDNKKAAEYYVKSLAIDPKNAETAYYAALAYSNLENYTEAKNYAQKALAVDSANKNAKELLTYVIEQENTEKIDNAIVLYEKQQYAQAISILDSVIAQDQKDSNAYYYRGMVYDAQKKYPQAINDYKKALENNSQMLIAYYSIAIDYDYLSQYANALTYHKKYLAETRKVGETNDYTRYSARRIQDLKAYEPQTTAAKK